jgi:hypothetical protein
MEYEMASLASEELVELYHKTNSELSKNILAGSPLNEQEDRIKALSEISKELTRRRIEIEDPFNAAHHVH